jgi:rare lipoprotein A
MVRKSVAVAAAVLLVTSLEPTRTTGREADECGVASIYSTVSEETASGEDTRAEDLTAAHRSLPFGTLVYVNNQKNGRSVVVRITDRGPFITGRIIDLSQIAARALEISGVAEVCLGIPTSSDMPGAAEE